MNKSENSKLTIMASDEGLSYGLCKGETTGPGACSEIDVSDLSLSYRGKLAFSKVSISMRPCAATVLMGPSGCGKTSFLSCLNRLSDLIPGAQVKGSIRIGKTSVSDPALNLTKLRRQVGMIFQRPTPFPLSIWKNLEFPLREHGIRSKSEREGMIESSLKLVGLWPEVSDRLKTSALALSGGQQQRLCIARSLALQPEILLLDEPCSALDPISSAYVEDLLMSLKGRYTLVIVTHNLAQARRIADDVALFWADENGGRLVEHGEAEQIFSEPTEQITKNYVSGALG